MDNHNVAYGVLFLCRHTDDALSASVLCGIGINGVSLYISAVGHCNDAVVTLDKVLVVYIVNGILNFRIAFVAVFIGNCGKLGFERFAHSLRLFENILIIGNLRFKRLEFLLQLETVKPLKLFESHFKYCARLRVAE